MIRPNEEKLMAFADGQLPTEETLEIEALIAIDAELRATVEDCRASSALIRSAFDEVMYEPPPQALVDAIMNGPRRRRDETNAPPLRRRAVVDRWRLPLAAGIALLLGVGIGHCLDDSRIPVDAPLGIALGVVAPTGPLARLLETTASGSAVETPRSDAKLTAVVTFRDRNGRICREVELMSAGTDAVPHAAAVACRDASRGWVVVGAINLAAPSETGGRYVPSGTREQDALEALLKTIGAGTALSAEDEARLIVRNWRD